LEIIVNAHPLSKWTQRIYWHCSPFKNNNLIIMNPIVVFSIEAKDPNTPSSTTVDITNVTIVNLVLMHDKQ
jgi:hypothetical protein